ncbi:hypothetical protein ELI25_02630 [Rhizobium ruizarguesonis]|nr:hypothetical protein ELI25_02630 [Rhizobium ruizarguesonis]TAW97019.1 hypothetical protein ELI12_02635 [Rhizobium ruizarguesonis]TAZ50147.1 hypothetical protein ELH76_02630 [Rhizobium ruizarguesonis]
MAIPVEQEVISRVNSQSRARFCWPLKPHENELVISVSRLQRHPLNSFRLCLCRIDAERLEAEALFVRRLEQFAQRRKC